MTIAFNVNRGGLSFYANGRMFNIVADHPNFLALRLGLTTGTLSADELIKLVSVVAQANGRLTVEGGEVFLDGNKLENVWTKKIRDFFYAKIPFDPVFKALDSLSRNPSFDARSRLPIFVEENKLGFLSDGQILACKIVNDNFSDVHSGTFDNTPGQVLEMPRTQVDDNPTNTCSAGFHLGALSYLKTFGLYDPSRRVVSCSFWPEHVVAVPVDYNGGKIRVEKYKVLEEVDKSTIEEFVKQNQTLVDRYEEDLDEDEGWNSDVVFVIDIDDNN